MPKDARTALNKACYKGHTDAVRALLASGVDAKATWWEQTPLVAAVRGGNLAVVELLLEHGADLAGQEGDRPLIAAVQQATQEIVRLLLERGADVNAGDGEGTTPLMIAATDGKAALVRLLLEAGSDPNLENKWGETALSRAGSIFTIGKKPDVVVELIDAGAEMSGRTFPRKLSLVGGVDRENPVPWGVAFNMRDESGNTLLMIAAAAGRRPAIERLVDEVPLKAVNKAGQTALALAEASGQVEIANGLRRSGQHSS